MSVDQTYHTPSFGDEEFDIPPLAYAPAAAATRCSGQGVYSNQVPVEYLKRKLNSDPFCVYLPRQDNFNDCSLYNQQPLSHFRPPESLVHSSYHHSPNMNSEQAFHQQQQQQNRQDCYQNNMLHSMSMQMSYDDRGPYAENHMQPPQMTVLHQQNHMMGPPQQTPMFSTINQSQLGLQMGHAPQNSQGGSPPGSNHNSPGLETSEDSDDSTPLAQLMSTMKQRPSPEPTEVSVRAPKKPKAQKKKKKRDPNEPQKPVSAYALFFRDTQAAIKGQNPNASFGEVSKIVAAMWDSLDADAKQSYKAKTENAKKEYLKQLAAYRATLVSKAAVDQSEPMYGNNVPNASPPSSHSPPGVGSPHGQMMQKPVLTSVVDSMQPVTNSMNMHPQNQQGWHMQSPHHMNNNSPPHVVPQGNNQMMGMHQSQPSQMSPQHHQQMGTLNNNNNIHVNSPQMCNSASNSPSYNQNMSSVSPTNGGNHTNLGGNGEMLPTCLRNGCSNPAIDSADWDREYCSSECVVSHCKDVFANWVAQRQVTSNPYSTVK